MKPALKQVEAAGKLWSSQKTKEEKVVAYTIKMHRDENSNVVGDVKAADRISSYFTASALTKFLAVDKAKPSDQPAVASRLKADAVTLVKKATEFHKAAGDGQTRSLGEALVILCKTLEKTIDELSKG